MLKLLISLSLLVITTCTIYNVTPDDTTCHHCHNLQHYLLNTTKYFTSNTQLLFLPGLHHLHTNLIIQNVHNISLIGSTTNGTTPDTVIQCDSSVGIVMNNITSLVIKNVVIKSCTAGYDQHSVSNIALLITWCSFIKLHLIEIRHTNISSFKGINIFGDSSLVYITCDTLSLYYDKTSLDINNQSTVVIDHFHTIIQRKMICILLSKSEHCTNKLTLQVMNTRISSVSDFLVANFFRVFNRDKILITNCQTYDRTLDKHSTTTAFKFIGIHLSVHFNNCVFSSLFSTKVAISTMRAFHIEINHCEFYGYGATNGLLPIIDIYTCEHVIIKNSNFHHLITSQLINIEVSDKYINNAMVIIQNTTFSDNNITLYSLICITNATLILIGPVKFKRNIFDIEWWKNALEYQTVIELHNSKISAQGYIEFFNNRMKSIIYHICIKELDCFYFSIFGSTIINITSNTISTYFIAEFEQTSSPKFNYPVCYFQYYHTKDQHIIVDNNKYKRFIVYFDDVLISDNAFDYKFHVTHCYWLPQSAFIGIIPINVNKKMVKYTNNSNWLPRLNQNKTLCYCKTEKDFDCYREELGILYPGQTLALPVYLVYNFTFKVEVIAEIDTNYTHFTPCTVYNAKQHKQLVGSGCNKLQYTIAFPTDNWCEIFLKLPHIIPLEYSTFYIQQLPCPLGFIKLNGICQCYPSFKLFGITNCDINTQTILRPENTWISAVNNNSYYISKHCPFHYCLQYPSHFNLSTPDSQCQFNRSGLLCGHCQHGLSTVFGSSYCKQCSSLYLTLIIPIGIAGLLLVLLLFLLNLTVTDGSINAFIFYVNIISINSTVFFPYQHTVSPAYIFISLANLDLGIQTCFYNGMDDYAKMWLQLTFPFYLIFLATLLIITSRYSTTIQRLTANRALPVLATLFLLSYTKILRTVSSVLFFYSSITHLPSQHTTQVWSVDANIPLFGVKFTMLFIVCLGLFLLLIPFNIILLFTRTLSRFNVINKFKPLLDAYQGPYKIKFYYWTGLQLVIRVAFFGMSSLDVNINLTAVVVMLSLFEGAQIICKPFKNKFKNYQELFLIINLLLLYTFTLSSQGDVNMIAINIMIAMAVLHFSLIIMYHIITYMCGGVISERLQSGINVCIRAIKLKQKSETEHFNLLNHNIPDVTYNYQEYREPVIGSDYHN